MINAHHTNTIAVSFAQFLMNRNSENDEINDIHCAMGDHHIEFPASVSEFIAAVSVGTSDDGELQHSVEVLAHIMREAGDYLLMALIEHQKNQLGEAT